MIRSAATTPAVHRSHHRSVLLLMATVALTAAVLTAVARHAGAGATAPVPPSTTASPVAQAQWLCDQAAYQSSAGTADDFLSWVAGTCAADGAQGLADRATSGTAGSAGAGTGGNGSSPAGSSTGPSGSAGTVASPVAGTAANAGTGDTASTTVAGDLICQYAEAQVAAGTATHQDSVMAASCRQLPPAPQYGVQADVGQPPATFDVDATDRWVGDVNGVTVIVWAGAEPADLGDVPGDPRTGVVVAFDAGATGAAPLRSTVAGSGALTITGASGEVLTLSAADGGTYSYDTATGALSPVGSAGDGGTAGGTTAMGSARG